MPSTRPSPRCWRGRARTSSPPATATSLGGATLDLSGGTYLISEPVHIPMLHANFRITGGTLRAAASFPKDRYMIEIGACADEAPCPHPPTPAPSLLPLPPTDP